MKKLVLILLFLFSLTLASFAIVGDGFYLENHESVEVQGRAAHVLPNTLRLVLEVGQSETLSATVLPEDSRDSFVSWKSSNGEIMKLYPEGNTCRVYGAAVGEGEVQISTLGGAKSSVAIKVEEKQEVMTRDFEAEEKIEKNDSGIHTLVRNIIRSLFGFSVMLISVALICLFRKEDKAR